MFSYFPETPQKTLRIGSATPSYAARSALPREPERARR
jgi:hypothetical protein